jgi:hypothetical protein
VHLFYREQAFAIMPNTAVCKTRIQNSRALLTPNSILDFRFWILDWAIPCQAAVLEIESM